MNEQPETVNAGATTTSEGVVVPTSRLLLDLVAVVSRSRDYLMEQLRWERTEKAKAESQLAALREVCICAAIQLPSGELFRGHRHDDAIQTAGKAGVSRDLIVASEQGFITSRNRFVGRKEGAELQAAAGIPSAQTNNLPDGMLFSEDLYLRSTNGQQRAAIASSRLPSRQEEGRKS